MVQGRPDRRGFARLPVPGVVITWGRSHSWEMAGPADRGGLHGGRFGCSRGRASHQRDWRASVGERGGATGMQVPLPADPPAPPRLTSRQKDYCSSSEIVTIGPASAAIPEQSIWKLLMRLNPITILCIALPPPR